MVQKEDLRTYNGPPFDYFAFHRLVSNLKAFIEIELSKRWIGVLLVSCVFRRAGLCGVLFSVFYDRPRLPT